MTVGVSGFARARRDHRHCLNAPRWTETHPMLEKCHYPSEKGNGSGSGKVL